jgi:hypothetical protein
MCWATGRKVVGSIELASLRWREQVAGAAGSRNRPKPPMFFCLEFEPKKKHFVSNSADEICVSHQKPVSNLISLARAIVHATFVLPTRLHPPLFDLLSSL